MRVKDGRWNGSGRSIPANRSSGPSTVTPPEWSCPLEEGAASSASAEEQGRLHSTLLLLYGADDEAQVAFDGGNTPADIAADVTAIVG